MTENQSAVQTILDRLGIPGREYQNVYWIGRKASRLTFVSQQQRALNLIWALKEAGRLDRFSEITVVGAGLAGLTAAFAANELGAKVTLSFPLRFRSAPRPKTGPDASLSEDMDAAVDDEVYWVGGRSGCLRRGVVHAVDVTHLMDGWGEQYLYDGTFAILH